MLFSKKSVILAGLVFTLLPLASCANTPFAERFERSLAADPRLTNTPNAGPSSPTPTGDNVQLPADFPSDIPRYPGAELLAVIPADLSTTAASGQATESRWRTPDRADQVQQFYRDILRSNDWRILQPTADNPTPESADESADIVAERSGIRLTLSVTPSSTPVPAPGSGTDFTLSYSQSDPNLASSPTPTPTSGGVIASSSVPQPGDPNFVGPLPQSGATPRPTQSEPATPTAAPQTFSDLSQAPEELRSYIEDLAKLGVLSTNSSSREFKPNAIATRRDYARWLVAANNAIYRDRPAQKIRLGVNTDEPVFRDVPRNDPDFAAIQGLAQAGLIPSPLSGDATTLTFRPDAPLTRENLILWKAPVDVRQTLPNATVQAIQETWGFQDANRIDSRSLRAVLADFQNGDLSNIRRAFGYTTLFQPKKNVTRAEAAAVLWYFGTQGDGLSAKDALAE
ncbi:MAG: S-layer homology domain-containing protein [Oculatellaceae cyanobacterium bins.114]|nr:S-layer homology domain-containing protein [Oculatellaceae cyanobacterium bins.114]